MNSEKSSNYGKIIAFFLIASILLCTFGFAAEGWQSITDDDENDSLQSDDDESDEIENDNTESVPEPEPYVPKYFNVLTGVEVDELSSKIRPACFVFSTDAPTYGIHGAELLIEIPTEAYSRMLVFTSSYSDLGKIGSLSPTRGYISNLAKYFDGILVSCGCDDTVDYSSEDVGKSYFDLSLISGYHYTEFNKFAYTNGALISAGIANANIGTATNSRLTMPFRFVEFDSQPIIYEASANNISLPFGNDSVTDLIYSENDHRYTFTKNGEHKTDLLTDEVTAFTNAFVLFSDSITYENAKGTEMIIDTVGGGLGYYATEGTVTEITWAVNAQGSLEFFNSDGQPLDINRGSSYIGFVKSSLYDSVIIS